MNTRLLALVLFACVDAVHCKVALCVAGEIRTFFQEDVQSNFKSALLDPLHPDLFFQVSVEDSSRLKPSPFKTVAVETARQRMLSLKPTQVNIATDLQLETHTLWLGDFIPFAHLSFRWSLCLNDIEDEEKRGGFQYQWIIRTRPDLIWTCSLPQQFTWASVANIIFIWDMVVVMDRAHAQIVLRQYPNSFGTLPCVLGYSEHCQWSTALRSSNRNSSQVRWMPAFGDEALINFRRHCVVQNTSCVQHQLSKNHERILQECKCRNSSLHRTPMQGLSLADKILLVNSRALPFKKSLGYITI